MILAIGFTFFALIVALFLTTRITVLNSFSDLEQQEARQNVMRTFGALDRSLYNLDAWAYDWGSWDDSWNFMHDQNEDFIESNLADGTFKGLRLNLLLYVDTMGNIVHGKAFDLENDEEVPVSKGMEEHVLQSYRLANEAVKGILVLDDRALVVASRPVLTSRDQGPPRGWIIMGRYLSKAEIEQLSGVTQLSLAFRLYGEPGLPESLREERPDSQKELPIVLETLGSQSIAGYMVLDDIYGDPAVVLVTEMPRTIYQQGVQTMTYFLLGLIVLGLGFGALTIFITERWVLSRLARLTANVNTISASGNPTGSVQIPGTDELSTLAGSIDGMLGALSESQKVLQQEEMRYRLLAENASDVILTTDMDLRYTYVSPSVTHLTGFVADELRGRNLSTNLLPDSHALVLRRMRAEVDSLNEGHGNERHPWTAEVELLCKDGSHKWTEIQFTFILDQDSRPAGILGVARDITERRQAEGIIQRKLEMEKVIADVSSRFIQTEDVDEAIRQSLEDIGRFVGARRASVYVLPQDGCNAGITHMWPCKHMESREALSGSIFVETCPWLAKRILDGETLRIGVLDLPDEAVMDKHVLLAHGIATVLASPIIIGSRPAGILSCEIAAGDDDQALEKLSVIRICSEIISNAMERRRAEREILESEAKYRNLVENTNDVIFYLDALGRFTYVSPAISLLLGFEPEQLVGETLTRFVHGDDLNALFENLQRTVAGQVEPFELRVLDRHYTIRYVRVSGRAAHKDGRWLGITGIMTDITERKIIEKRMEEHSDDLERMVADRTRQLTDAQERLIRAEKLAAIGELAGGLGHELRSPLAAIRFSVEYLRSRLDKDSARGSLVDEKIQRHLEMLEKQINACDKTIADVLDFSRPKETELGRVDINQVAYGIFEGILVPKSVAVQSLLSPDLPGVRADAGHVSRILHNLITNAVQAMPRGGTLTVSTSHRGESAEMVVSDTGVGIPEDSMDKIFEPLYTTKAKGIGLGLSIVKALVEKQSGYIRVQSREGVGTTFTVGLPVIEETLE